MKRFTKKIEAVFSAATFAEANEHETALGFLRRSENLEESTERAWGQKIANDGQHNKTTLRKTIEDHFVAAAFAEAGAVEMARKMLPEYRRKQKVLLAIEGSQPSKSTFDYAVNLCKRINAGLHILQIIPQGAQDQGKAKEALTRMLATLETEDILFEVTCREVGANDVLYDHLKNHREVSVAVVDAPSLRESGANNIRWRETFGKITQKLSVPLVTALQR